MSFSDMDKEIEESIPLAKGFQLIRVINKAGVPYSYIFKNGFEMCSCERGKEANMLVYFNETH